MTMRIEDYECQFCGKTATNFIFAAFVCDSEECIEKAREERGGPGGHMKRKAQGLPILPDNIDEDQ
ncbi:MAG: hypothetical protein FWG58_03385 [Methanomassiliicoccaceae archaeon]|nr:hypothetical protein [Methanomassiliicoccaceae archaeon]